MKILYDDQIFTMQKHGGISRYFAELLNVFKNSDGIDYEVTTRFTENFYEHKYNLANRKLSQRIENIFFYWAERVERYAADVAAAKEKINKTQKDKLFHEAKYDVFHPTYYNPYFLNIITEKPLVVTAHDMIHELFPEMYPLDDIKSQMTTHWKKSVFSRADRIIAVSENTKKDIVRLFGIDKEKIAVVYHASSINNSSTSCNITLPDKYILYVGERIRYKNFIPFIRAIADLLRKDRDLYVVCVGGRELTDSEKQLFIDLSIDGQILQFTVNDGALASFYRRAQLFVFPSLYEGFGMPVLEAFSCGCPSILSDTSSFPEVANAAALYFNPLDNGSIRDGVERILNDRELRERLIKAGLQRVSSFSWEKTANETRAVYETLV